MKKMNLIIIFLMINTIVASLMINTIAASAEDIFQTKKLKDSTICIKYNFKKGDVLRYYGISHDSIIFNYAKPLLKIRREIIELRCLEANKKGDFLLQQTMISYSSKETIGDSSGESNSDPWVGTIIKFRMDSLGIRKDYIPESRDIANAAPGGVFQPLLLHPLGQNCRRINESWILTDTFALAENAYPLPLVRYSYFYRAVDPLDTLGQLCNRAEFINTGQGNYELASEENNIQVTAVFNGAGKTDFNDRNIPIHIHNTLEQKITIHRSDGLKNYGKHFITSNFTLTDFKNE